MTGTVYQRANRWYFRHDVGMDREGRRKQRNGGGFETEAEARKELARSILRHQAGLPTEDLSEILMQHAHAALKRAFLMTRQKPSRRGAPRGQIAGWGWTPGNDGENRIIRALHAREVIPEEVHQQFPIGPFCLDFAWVRDRTAVEADGWVHGHPETMVKDAARDTILTTWGWEVHRIAVDAPDDVFNEQIDAALVAIRRRGRAEKGGTDDATDG